MDLFVVIFFVAGFTQLCFLAMLLTAFARKRTPPATTDPKPVSLIVCAHDEEQNLRQLLPLLMTQAYDHFEVIVVEDRSNDGSYDYLLEATQRYPNLKMVRITSKPEHINGKKFALTLGIKAAKYEMVLLTDADCRPKGKHWVQEMMSRFGENTSIVLGYSPHVKLNGMLNAFIRFEGLLTGIQYIGFALLGRPYMGVGRNVAYRKSLFLDNKGFNGHQTITGGDDDLFINAHASKFNTAVSIGKKALVYTIPERTWREFYIQKLRHLSVGRFYKFSDRVVLGMFMVSWLLFWLSVGPAALVNEPWAHHGIVGLLLARWIFLISLFHSASRKMGDPFEAWKVPFLDIIYTIYYLVTGLSALKSKRIRWKRI